MSETPLDLLLFEWLCDFFLDITKYKGENGCQGFFVAY